ncbi:hypothetical protein Q5752_001059 [Cryptotrichosporon argae]
MASPTSSHTSLPSPATGAASDLTPSAAGSTAATATAASAVSSRARNGSSTSGPPARSSSRASTSTSSAASSTSRASMATSTLPAVSSTSRVFAISTVSTMTGAGPSAASSARYIYLTTFAADFPTGPVQTAAVEAGRGYVFFASAPLLDGLTLFATTLAALAVLSLALIAGSQRRATRGRAKVDAMLGDDVRWAEVGDGPGARGQARAGLLGKLEVR